MIHYKFFTNTQISEDGNECEITVKKDFKIKLIVSEGMMNYEILDKKQNLLTTGSINLYSIKEE